MKPTSSRMLARVGLIASLALGACTSPPEHLVRLWPAGTSGEPVLGLSTQDGILMLSEPHFERDDVFEVQHPYGNSTVSGHAFIDHLNEEITLAHMLNARVSEGRFAAYDPDWDLETVYLALRDDDDEVDLVEVERWRDGVHGDWLSYDADEAEALARDWAGAGLYVRRREHWQIVGLLAGITAHLEGDDDDVGLGYISLVEIARILPDHVDYFEHDIEPLRPDFEFGVPLQPGDVVLEQPEDRAGAGDGR